MSHYAPGPTPPITASPSQPPLEDEDGGEDNIFRDMTFEEVLEDLNARFLVNLPEEEMSLVRVYWQAEQAHWFYEDYLRPLNPLLPSLGQRQFTHLIIASSPLYADTDIDYDAVWEEYCAYKKMVPCCGGILINDTADKVLMVEEETGFDLSGLINEDDFIKTQVNAQEITMFIVPGIDESTVFETQTRKEIGAIEWVPFSDLPTWTHKKGPKRTGGKGQKRFYNVTPFVGPLKKWLSKHGYNPHPPRRKEKTGPVGRELKPFAFDDAPAQKAHPTTALDHLFAKFIEKDETAVALESDNARTLDRLFGSLEVSDGSHQAQTQQQRSDDDALAKLLSGIGHVSAPPPAPQLQPSLPEKQTKFLSVLNQKAPAPLTPPRSTHQTNLLSMLASPPKVAQHDPTPPPASHQGNLLNMLSSGPQQPHQQAPPEDQMARQRALLEASFGGVGEQTAATPPPRAVSASSMMSPMPPLPPAEGGWYGQQESALHGPPGTPGYQRLPMPGSPRGIPGSPVRGGYPQNQLRQTALHNSQRYPAPPQPQPQPQAYQQPPQPQQAYQQPPPQQYQQPPQSYQQPQPPQPANDHQRALLGALFNGRQAPPHMQQPPVPQQQMPQQFNGYNQQYPQQVPQGAPQVPPGYAPYPSPGAPNVPPQMNPQMGYGYNTYPQQPPSQPQHPPQPQQPQQQPPQQQQQQHQSMPQPQPAPAQSVQQPAVGPPNPPSPSVHQPVPRPPVGGGLLGLMSR
ncbi:deadenylation-dependent decapping-related protein [Trichosporon asahii var. asahii CBS 2479]|uniref:Deadenylation-dependent decapping-related protein n=1 Tax=Trichosporon asahii var. asahii (strain ATCC 90039 / CBS 2479 / JCM 2466 / KCTC 7840 / NBRC 103889/ NCYC 2677 / UAMH 7654) TaxID=1186058 RepID=J5QH98_TRIAS|nr:deadenylation-dependent decapping-related protein [Trichosporon asahii var. asahii CBS 2479]EJT47348.1 deadenylation-dependent decapping-related protein [Trichosporon asahii var. asahii CBS 2479]